jgi:hypothetical protein
MTDADAYDRRTVITFTDPREATTYARVRPPPADHALCPGTSEVLTRSIPVLHTQTNGPSVTLSITLVTLSI